MGKAGRRSVGALPLVHGEDAGSSSAEDGVALKKLIKKNGERSEEKKGKRKGAAASSVVLLVERVRAEWSKIRAEPAKNGKPLVIMLCKGLLALAVLLSVLHVLGGEGGSSTGAVETSSTPGSGGFLGLLGFGRQAAASAPAPIILDEDGNPILDKKDEEDTEEIPEMIGYTKKEGNKVDKKKEKALACQEADCNIACMKKINAKCATKKSCFADREKVCKRRCLKTRCEERCKDEPKYGYVEREQKMDKCKEGCTGPTTQHNKCIKKCHADFKPCKARCHEIASKFSCDVAKPVLSFQSTERESLRSNTDEDDVDVDASADNGEDEGFSELSSTASAAELDDEVI